MKLNRKLAGPILGVALAASATACHPRMAGQLLGAAIITAAIIGTASVLAAHDAHFHSEYCGHPRRYHDGRWVYHYNGHWEYHHGGRWYYYGSPPPSAPGTVVY